MAATSLCLPNLLRISTMVHLKQKHARKGILRTVVQPSQIDTFFNGYVQTLLFNGSSDSPIALELAVANSFFP